MQINLRRPCVAGNGGPIRVRQKTRDDVSDVKETGKQENLLDSLIGPAHHQHPHKEGRAWDGKKFINVESPKISADNSREEIYNAVSS